MPEPPENQLGRSRLSGIFGRNALFPPPSAGGGSGWATRLTTASGTKTGIGHAERREEPLLQEAIKILAGDHLDDAAHRSVAMP